ncbi:MAG TPA: TolC family protein [Fulvivirga sp.]|nr:TolC family protein [Fulvivirga sp.]
MIYKLSIITTLVLVSCAFSQAQDQITIESPLTFKEAVEIGLKKNINLKRQSNQLESIEAQRLNARGQYLPSLGISGQGMRTDGQQINSVSGAGENITSDRFGGSIDANYTLFNGFNRLQNMKASSMAFQAQSSGVQRAKQDVIADITNQFLQVLFDQELVRIAKENLETQEVILEQIKGFVESGIRAMPEEYSQIAIVKNNELLLIRAQNTYANDKSTLSQMLQFDPTLAYEIAVPEWNVEEVIALQYDLDELYNQATVNRYDLKQSQLQSEASKFQMKARSSGYLPSFGIFMSYGSQYFAIQGKEGVSSFNKQFFDLNPQLSYGFNFSIPLFDRFQTHSNKTQAKVNYLNAENDYENLQKTVLIDVQRAHQNFKNAIIGYRAAQAQLESAQLSFDLEKERYDLGLSSLVEYNQANQRFVQAQADMAQAKYTLLFQDILLQYAIGTLGIDDIH